MRTLVTGAAGFAGRWLVRELASAGHVVATDRDDGVRVEITDRPAVMALIDRTRPDLVFHLAAVSFGPDADADPARALEVNVGGTAVLIDALGRQARPPAVVAVSSAEVYRLTETAGRPVDETTPTVPIRPYGLSKLGQESVALAMSSAMDVRVAVVRPFNHTGPGQRAVFAIPAYAQRIVDARARGAGVITAGNMDVRRDIADVRDVVVAYRLVGEGLVAGTIPPGSRFNVATGTARRIGEIVDRLGILAGYPVRAEVDPALVRAGDPPLVVGDATALRAATGWRPGIPFDETLTAVLADLARRRGSLSPGG